MRAGLSFILSALATFAFAAMPATAAPAEIEFGLTIGFSPDDVTSDFVAGEPTFEWNRNDPGPDYHSVTSDGGLFATGNASGFTQFELAASAGTYPYHCELHGFKGGGGMSGVVRVRPVGTPAGQGATGITWADDGTTTGTKYDARYKREGQSRWKEWLRKSDKTEGEFADGNGRLKLKSGKTYLIQVRSSGGGGTSKWSPSLSVDVS